MRSTALRRLAAEFLGTLILLAVVGSGIMAGSPGAVNVAIALP